MKAVLACVVAVVLLGLAPGCPGNDSDGGAPSDSGSDADANGNFDGGSSDSGSAGFAWPDGEPAAQSLYFTPDCGTASYCMGWDSSRRDSASLSCQNQGGVLTISATPTTGGSFELSFPVPAAPEVALATDGTTSLDWTTEDGSTYFAFFDDLSSGTAAFAACGSEVWGRFDIVDACEPHTYGMPDRWLMGLSGAFKCSVSGGPLDCGL